MMKSHRNILIILSLIIVSFLIYFKTVFYGLILLDDGDIHKNFDFLSNYSNIWAVFSHSYWGLQGATVSSYHRPFVTAITILLCSLSKTLFHEFNPGLFHAVNVVLHITSVLLVFSILMRFRIGKFLAWWLTVAFSIHPLHVPTVAWIGGVNDLLLMNFSLVSLWSFQRFTETKKFSHLLFHSFFLLCALLTKENAIVLVVLLPLSAIVWNSNEESPLKINQFWLNWIQFFKENGSTLIAWAIILSLFFSVRSLTGSSVDSPSLDDVVKSVLFSWPGILTYFGKFFLPRGLAGLPVLPNTPIGPSIIAILVLVVWIKNLKTIKSKSFLTVFFGFAWFLFFLIPTFVRFNPQFWSSAFVLREDRTYTANFGLLLAFGSLIQMYGQDSIKWLGQKSAWVKGVMAVVLLIFASMTTRRMSHYKDDLEFYKSVVKESPSLSFGYVNLGTAYVFRNDFESANRYFELALKMNPNERKLNNNIGVIQLRSGKFQEARNSFLKELEHYPDYYESWLGLGQTAVLLDEEQLAKDAFQRASRLRPNDPEAEVNLLSYLRKKGRLKDVEILKSNLEKKGIQILEK